MKKLLTKSNEKSVILPVAASAVKQRTTTNCLILLLSQG